LLRKIATSLAGAVEDRVKRISDRLLARSLANNRSLSFSEDYVSNFTADWTEHLSHLQGREGVAFLEIGCFEGRSTLWFLENILTHPSATIACIDSFSRGGGEPRFEHNIALSGYTSRVTKIKGRSEDELFELTRESFDAIYIDGSHRAVDVLMDAVAAWQLLKPGGTMIFDDYGWGEDRPAADRPRRAIDLFIDLLGPRAELRHRGYQVILRKVND